MTNDGEAMIDRDGWLATPHIPPDYGGAADPHFTPVSPHLLQRPVLDTLRDTVARAAGRTMFDDGTRTMTYGEILRTTGHLVRMLRAAPGPPGPVGLLLPGGAAYLVAALACLGVGRPCVLLDAQVPHERNETLIRETGTTLLLVEAASGAHATAAEVPRLAIDAAFVAAGPEAAPENRLDLDAPAFILCTSGSTGRPKAIVHSQRTMLHRVAVNIDAIHIGPDDRGLGIESPATLGGIITHLAFPLVGASLQTFNLKRHGFRGLFDIVHSRPITNLRASPSLLRTIMQLPGAAAALARVRNVTTYGEPLLRSDLALLFAGLPKGCRILSFYGSTESCGTVWYARQADDFDPLRVPAGVLMFDTEAMIVDDDGASCPSGSVGELVIRSRYNALGEWRDGGCVPGRLLSDPRDPAKRIYHTGDMARRTADGVFVVLGRKDRMVKINGQRVEPAEIETALRHSPHVLQAAVVPRRQGDQVTLLAFVVLRPGPDAGQEEALRAMLRNAFPTFMLPSRIVALATLPLLPSGKPDIQTLLKTV